jgi:glucokinase
MIGVDIGGTNIRVALINDEMKIIRKETALTSDFPLIDDFLQEILRLIKIVDCKREADCIGIAIPTPWKKGQSVIVDSTNVPCLENVNIDLFQKYFVGYTTYFENDVNVIALLEANLGAAQNYDNSIYISISTGIGCGIVINNQIYHGAHGYAGEIGNILLQKAYGEVTNNNFEMKCSGKALDGESSRLFGEGAKAKDLFLQYKNGDRNAKMCLETWIDDLSTGFASVIQMFDPEVIVLGGPIVFHHEWVLEVLKTEISKKVLGNLANHIKLALAKYELEAGIIGAGYYAFNQNKGE